MNLHEGQTQRIHSQNFLILKNEFGISQTLLANVYFHYLGIWFSVSFPSHCLLGANLLQLETVLLSLSPTIVLPVTFITIQSVLRINDVDILCGALWNCSSYICISLYLESDSESSVERVKENSVFSRCFWPCANLLNNIVYNLSFRKS